MKDYKYELSIIISVFIFGILFFVVPVKAASYFTAWFDITNDPNFGSQHEAQYAPSTLNFVFISYSYTDASNTDLKIDCNNDGIYEINKNIPISPSYPMAEGAVQSYWINAGDYNQNIVPRADEPAYWGGARGDLKCYYPHSGNYTIKMIAERGGLQIKSEKKFTIKESSVDMKASPFYKKDIIGMIGSYSGSYYEGKLPKAPADIDFGAAIFNPNTYNGYAHWPLFTDSAVLKFDCTNDGIFDKTVNYIAQPYSAFDSSWKSSSEWSAWCIATGYWEGNAAACYYTVNNSMNWYSNTCHYDSPGIYNAKIRAELPLGAGEGSYIKETIVQVPIFPSASDASVDFSNGGDPVLGEAPLKMGLKVNVSGVIWANASYLLDCGDKNDINKNKREIISINSTNDFNQNYSYATDKNFCNYSEPGEYTATAKLTFNANNFPGNGRNILPFTEVSRSNGFITYLVQKDFKITVTGKVAGASCVGADECYNEQSPFDLKWDAANADSCSVIGVGNSFSKTNLPSSDQVSVSKLAKGDYVFKLVCSGPGGSKERIIKIKVPN
jgi:hypothetical protein